MACSCVLGHFCISCLCFTVAGNSSEELNVSSERDLVVFETSHLLLSPHSRGLGQQSGYWELESGNTAQEYVGLFTTLSQLKKKLFRNDLFKSQICVK